MTPLEEYQRKRDFGRTPEPGAIEGAGHAGGLTYVIQKHAASRLHYDFRIELGGVMLSWAVPKGPSLDPADKRLAMHVEDHPIAYSAFEGTIPKGEYGGGTVMVWDRGTWEPDHGDPAEHLAQGHLKFFLHGERLRGRWMLVRTKGYGGRSSSESWLLFKEHDDEERPRAEFDVTSEYMTSVATGRTMEQIAENSEAVWHSNESAEENIASLGLGAGTAAGAADPSHVAGARKSRMPRKVDVALATLVDEPPTGEGWLHEIKFDGYRIVAFLDHGKVRLMSRNGIDWTARLSPVADAVATLPYEQAVIDGEVVVMRPDGTTDFQALQNHAKSHTPAELTYMAFDLLYLDGYDLAEAAQTQRKALLKTAISSAGETIRYSDDIEGSGAEFFDRACKVGLEGIMAKRTDAPYHSGRGKAWLKIKCLLRQEFAVVGWTDPGGTRKGFGALVLAVRENGDLVHVGRVGTGFTEASITEILAQLEPLAVQDAPVANPPRGPAGRGVHWVRPELVAEVAFAEWTAERSLRHPSFKGLREDKSASEIRIETPQDTDIVQPTAEAEPAAAGAQGDARSRWAGVTLTNPDRVLWPDVPFTKSQLAEYYEAVGELMLPHVAGRPLSLVRCPSGYTGECFYQKHIEHFPSSVDTIDIFEPEEGASKPYGTVHDLAGIIGLVQMGVLEIHPWGARNDDVDKPDRLVFDLDPDPEMPYRQIAATAMLLRSELSHLGLDSWVKTTGGKGLHVVVPVTRRHGWDTAKSFSAGFVNGIVAIEPKMFTSNMSKAKRGGKIYIDYLRNSRGATAIAPYCTRARPGAPVAVPLAWDELVAGEPLAFNVFSVRTRLGEIARDPWGDMGTTRQSITREMLKRVGASAGV